ncbi:MAG: hypothetical protein WA906_03615, partial [Pacificimonas sp.]
MISLRLFILGLALFVGIDVAHANSGRMSAGDIDRLVADRLATSGRSAFPVDPRLSYDLCEDEIEIFESSSGLRVSCPRVWQVHVRWKSGGAAPREATGSHQVVAV